MPFVETRLAMLLSFKSGQVWEKRIFLIIYFKCYEIFCYYFTLDTTLLNDTRPLVAYTLNECGLVSAWAASQQTNYDSTNCWVKSHWKPKRLYGGSALSVSTSSSSSIVWDASFFLWCHFQPPQCLSVSQWLPLVFGCHTTLVLCVAGTKCIMGVFFLPSSCMLLEGEGSYK